MFEYKSISSAAAVVVVVTEPREKAGFTAFGIFFRLLAFCGHLLHYVIILPFFFAVVDQFQV